MKCVVSSVVLITFLSIVQFAVGQQSDGAKKVGSIKGEVSVSGVKSPENVVIYVENVAGKWDPTEDAKMDQAKMMFDPMVLPVVTGTTVKFRNSDPVLHNIFWPKSKKYRRHNLGTWGKGAEKTYKFEKEGDVVLLCNVHPEMEGHVVVLQNPFFAVVDKDGDYEIKDVPAGSYTLKTWYVSSKKLRSKTAKVTVKEGDSSKVDFSLSRR